MIRRPNASILSLMLLALAAAPAGAQTPTEQPTAEAGAAGAGTPAPASPAPAAPEPAPAEGAAPTAPADGATPAPAAPAATPGAATAGATEENWAVNCVGEAEARRCTLLQNLVAQQGEAQQRLLTVLVQPDGNGGQTLLLALPHGLFLPAGAQIQIDDGEPQKLVIQTSDQNGSYAGTALGAELLASLRRGRELKVSFLSAQQQAATVPVTLVGFSAAYEELGQQTQAN